MLKRKDKYVIAIVGATGTVGREMMEILQERKFPVSDLILLASDHSAGERIEFSGRNWTVRQLVKDSFSGVDMAFFAAGDEQSLKFIPLAVKSGAVAIDSSRVFHADKMVPLVVPDVNPRAIGSHRGIIANPGSVAIALGTALKPLHDKVGLERVVATTFQSVSESGKAGQEELAHQTVALLNFQDVETKAFLHQIAFNCIPRIGNLLEDGYTDEEAALESELRKVLEADAVRVAVTMVRVPVFRCAAVSVNIETRTKLEINEARSVLAAAPGIVVFDDPARSLYPLQMDTAGKDDVYVGRIREDRSVANGLSFWIVYDNIRKGSALNSVQIAEELIRQ